MKAIDVAVSQLPARRSPLPTRPARFLGGLAILALLVAASPAPRDAHVEIATATKQLQRSAQQLAAMPRTRVVLDEHGAHATYEGTELWRLLALAGAPQGKALHGKELTQYIVVEGLDGYRAVLALAESDPAISDRTIILADRKNGQALSAKDGPFRLVIEREKRPARCVRQVRSIRVAAAP